MDASMIFDIKRKMLVKYPRFGSEIAKANIEIRDDLPFHTAATDGQNIYIDPNYFENLSENDRLFTIAHEIMHIKFMHVYRLKDKDGKKRDSELWNIATDAIINANLERDGFTIKDGYVNMPEALAYSAEEFYQILLQEKEKKKQNGDGQNQAENEQTSKNTNERNQGENEQTTMYGGEHSLWEEAFKNREKKKKQEKQQSQNGDEQNQDENEQTAMHGYEQNQNEDKPQKNSKEEQSTAGKQEMEFDEKNEFTKNREEKIKNFKKRQEKTNQKIRGNGKSTKLGNIGRSKEEIDWKLLLRREVEKTETIWTQRRSIAENNFAYRLEENDIEDDAETEIMIDVSGSVELGLVKAFLRQIKPLLNQSKLRVGCFDEQFFNFIDIRNERDIDKFSIPEGAGGGTDLDLPVRCFTKKREVNKIVFTDGYRLYAKKRFEKRRCYLACIWE